MGLADKLKVYEETSEAPPPYETVTDLEGRILERLRRIWTLNKLQGFYKDADLVKLARQMREVDFAGMSAQFDFPHSDLAIDFVIMALYDIVILGDDSGSMRAFPAEARDEELRTIVTAVSALAQAFDEDGIEVRWINDARELNGVKSAADITAFFAANAWSGMTDIAGALKKRVLGPLFDAKVKNKTLKKPLLVFVITDGLPDSQTAVVSAIQEAKATAKKSPYGEYAVAFAFAQVGKDRNAQKWLGEIDVHPVVGNSIDCTSNFEMEQMEFARNNVTLTAELWLMKLCLGAIDPALDAEDE